MKRSPNKVLLVSIILIPVLYLSSISILGDAYSSVENSGQSPSFPNQEIIDPNLDWIHMNNGSRADSGERSTDIETVDYYSDGKTLYAILWLYFPFQPVPSLLDEEVSYGMYIDADFDETTGFGGIEYKAEISWDNQTKRWSRVLEKWSHFGDTIVLENQTMPYTEFSKEDSNYVRLTVDLNDLLSPEKYKVIFYGEVRREGFLITDFTRLVAIPPLELSVSTSPNSVVLRKGEPKTIEVKVNTSQGYEPTINLEAKSQSEHLILDFTQNDTSPESKIALRIPSYGIATVPLTISSKDNAPIGSYSMFIFANSSFPPEEFLKPKPIKGYATTFLPPSVLTPENIFTQSSMLITLSEPLIWLDHISNFWNKLGGLLSFISGLLIGLGPMAFNKIREKWRSHRNVKKGSRP